MAGKPLAVRVFDIAITDGGGTHQGSVALDPDGHLVEMQLDGEHIVRAE